MLKISRFLARNWNLCNFGLFLPKFGCHGNSLENSGSTFEFTKPIKPYWTCKKFLDFLLETEICAILAYIFLNLVAMATHLLPLTIVIPYLKLPTQNSDFSCEKFLDFLHRTQISAILVYFLLKFGCYGNSLGSLKNSDSVLKFNSPEIPTVHAINFSISCTELMSAIFWPKFGCHGNHPDPHEILYNDVCTTNDAI